MQKANARNWDSGAAGLELAEKELQQDTNPQRQFQALTKPQLELFAIRCSELAGRVLAGTIPFIDAIDMAHSAAVWSGLVESVGDDGIQKVMAAAFMTVPRGAS
jgi:hypothetical protein